MLKSFTFLMANETGLQVENKPVTALKPFQENPKRHGGEQLRRLKKSMREFGWTNPILISQDNMIIAGHARYEAAKQLGFTEVPTIYIDLPYNKAVSYVLADNRLAEIAEQDDEQLNTLLESVYNDAEIDIEALGFTDGEIDRILAGVEEEISEDTGGDEEPGAEVSEEQQAEAREKLEEKFIAPPFTILDARQGYWRDRKRAWLQLGIQSELGRDAECLQTNIGEAYGRKEMTGTSVFDPVLCEVMYSWFSPPGCDILDIFAGGSVRGIVAAKTGRNYTGIDLSEEQIKANRRQWNDIIYLDDGDINWIVEDAQNVAEVCNGQKFDMLFTCPPYADLEVYSDDPNDLSNMDYTDFLTAYRTAISEAVALLKDNRFAVIVVANVRDGNGYYRDLVGDTVQAFEDAGMRYYNEAAFITPLGTLPVRAANPFQASRKLGKAHQNVLVFVKGDAKKATEACGEVEVMEVDYGGTGKEESGAPEQVDG